jgi:transposase
MVSHSLLNFITQIINIPNVKVINYHFITDDELLVEIENIPCQSVCPHCGSISTHIHQHHWYRVRDIPMSDYNVFLNINRRRFKCFDCGKVFSEQLDFVKKRRTYTKRLAEKVISEV